MSHWNDWWLLAQEKAPEGGGGGGLSSLLTNPFMPLIFIGVLFYLLMIRPERRKRDEHSRMLEALKPKDRIVTIGGILGTVVNVQKDSEEVTVRIDENTNTKIRVNRSAIARVVVDEPSSETKSLEKDTK